MASQNKDTFDQNIKLIQSELQAQENALNTKQKIMV
jgi:hypothetical protein